MYCLLLNRGSTVHTSPKHSLASFHVCRTGAWPTLMDTVKAGPKLALCADAVRTGKRLYWPEDHRIKSSLTTQHGSGARGFEGIH